jgi:beta-galactosidase
MKGLATYGFGGQGHSYWVWRQQRTGCEMLWGSLLYAWGQPTPRFSEVQEIAKDSAEIEAFLFAAPVPQAELAVHYSNHSHIVTAVEPMSAGYQYFQNWFEDAYQPVLASGVFRDVIFEAAAVENYKVIFTPFMPVIDAALLAKMQTWVENGGTWIVGPMTGYRTPDHTVPTEAALGTLEEFLGVPVTHFFPLVNMKQKIQLNDGPIVHGKYWGLSFCELDGTKSLGKYLEGPAAGQHFGFEKSIGAGKVILCGAALETEEQMGLIRGLLKSQRLDFDYEVTWGTTVAPREGSLRRGLVVANWNGAGGRVTLPEPGVNLVSREALSGEIQIAPFEVAFIEFR